MTKPIRATRDNLLPGTIWQNASGTCTAKILSRGERTLTVTSLNGMPHNVPISEFNKIDIWYQVQPIKETHE